MRREADDFFLDGRFEARVALFQGGGHIFGSGQPWPAPGVGVVGGDVDDPKLVCGLLPELFR